jgi:hypothetical protein
MPIEVDPGTWSARTYCAVRRLITLLDGLPETMAASILLDLARTCPAC